MLATGTFASVRSANRAARTAERTLLAGLRPLLVPSRLEDPPDKIMWIDDHWAKLSGGMASVELVDGRAYLALSLRNVGAGIAVLQGWHPPRSTSLDSRTPPSTSSAARSATSISPPAGSASGRGQWLCLVGRHWSLDRPGPR